MNWLKRLFADKRKRGVVSTEIGFLEVSILDETEDMYKVLYVEYPHALGTEWLWKHRVKILDILPDKP